MDTQTLKRWIAFFGWWLAIFTVCMVIALTVGCTYTHPSKSEPDLIERVTNGHKVCWLNDDEYDREVFTHFARITNPNEEKP